MEAPAEETVVLPGFEFKSASSDAMLGAPLQAEANPSTVRVGMMLAVSTKVCGIAS